MSEAHTRTRDRVLAGPTLSQRHAGPPSVGLRSIASVGLTGGAGPPNVTRMYGTEGTRCAASGGPVEGPGRLERPASRSCPVCGQELRFAAANGWPEHHVEPGDRPAAVVHRNDDADLLAARDASCTACARCDHEPDDPRCFDFCSNPGIGTWLPTEAAWACDNCTHPVVRPALKHAVTGTW